jgi:hypothetical protein
MKSTRLARAIAARAADDTQKPPESGLSLTGGAAFLLAKAQTYSDAPDAPKVASTGGHLMRSALVCLLLAIVAFPSAAIAQSKPSFSIDNPTAPEDSGRICFNIRKHGKLNNLPSSVSLSTIDGTARAPGDYARTGGPIAFAAGDLAKLACVSLTNDAVPEPAETFTGKLTAGTNARLYDGTATGTITDGDIIAPAPQPVPAPTPSPTDPLAGEVPEPDNFNTADGIEPFDFGNGAAQGRLPGESVEEVGAFRMRCNAGQLAKLDPLVFPGQSDVGHLHQFWGNTGVTPNSNYKSLRTSGGSTCGASNAPVNRTAYWMPAMLDGVGGVVKPDYINTYYKQHPAANCFKFAAKGCVGLPHGIRLVFGYDMVTGTQGLTNPNSHAYWAFKYDCYKSDDDQTPFVSGRFRSLKQLNDANACPIGARMQITFNVPGCWNGQIAAPDNRSHLSWGTPETGGQVCPASHPYLITPWQGQIKFTVDANFRTWRLASDHADDEPGSTLHFDYWEAWSPEIKARWQKNCIDAHKSCSSGDLGDGFWIKQTPVTAPGQRVPMP